MEQFEGYIDHIIFRSEESGYTVMVGVMAGKEYTLVGTVPGLAAGETIKASGHETKHAIYGKQFVIESYQSVEPQTEEAVKRYLGSGAIKGIGPSFAEKILRKFGKDTMRIIAEEPERLAEIKGISMKKAMDIAASVNSKRDMQDAVMFLQEYGISVRLAGKIFATYGNKMYDQIRENPYRLAEDIDGIGFQKCDEIARKAGIGIDSDFRIQAGILYALMQAEQSGHCYLPMDILTGYVEELLGIPLTELNNHLVSLQISGKVKVTEERVYRARVYYTELQVATQLLRLNQCEGEAYQEAVEAEIDEITGEEGIELDDLQREAVKIAASSGLLIMTGGPGTGKTTTIRTILRLFEKKGKTILLAAPTGRAAKRMSEATEWEARTIHRMLEYQGRPESEEGDGRAVRGHFEKNSSEPLEADVIIIDEMSMVDIFLMNSLLQAVAPGTRLILVGDANQLPSVGAGNVLRDLIESKAFPTVKLTHIFRQAMESDIVVNAHKIHAGEPVELGKPSRDFLFIKSNGPEQIFRSVTALLTDKLPKYLGVDPLELQVMTPQRKGALGVENLNRLLQEQLNPGAKNKPEREIGGTIFRLGDKVMQVRNDYNLIWEIRGKYGIPTERGEGVFNGDIGIITEINRLSETLTVQYEERFVEYPFKDCENLELAYAITIHKSQGSEYPAVVLPMYQGPKMLMNRNLLYTAVTRAKQCVCLVGSPVVFENMCRNESEAKRYSSLALQIRKLSNADSLEKEQQDLDEMMSYWEENGEFEDFE